MIRPICLRSSRGPDRGLNPQFEIRTTFETQCALTAEFGAATAEISRGQNKRPFSLQRPLVVCGALQRAAGQWPAARKLPLSSMGTLLHETAAKIGTQSNTVASVAVGMHYRSPWLLFRLPVRWSNRLWQPSGRVQRTARTCEQARCYCLIAPVSYSSMRSYELMCSHCSGAQRCACSIRSHVGRARQLTQHHQLTGLNQVHSAVRMFHVHNSCKLQAL